MSEVEPIAKRVGKMLRERDETVAVAESCTGGEICSLLTDPPGASDYFERGVIAYGYGTKLEELAVPRERLDEHGAVSEPVAAAMARGIRDRAGTTWGVGSTGIAGPGGGTEETPAGTLFVGIAYAGDWGTGDSFVTVDRYEIDGSRTERKARFARRALTDLADELERQ